MTGRQSAASGRLESIGDVAAWRGVDHDTGMSPNAIPAVIRLCLRTAALAALLAGVGLATSAVEPLSQPQGRVVLTVGGTIALHNAGGAAEFDMEMLLRLTAVEIVTTTIWTEGEQTFTGVPLKTVLEAVGATGSVIEASALNDYMTEIPAEDAVEGGAILAYAQNGEMLSVRDKGPLWIVYPYDADARWRSEVIYARSIWQLKSLTIRP